MTFRTDRLLASPLTDYNREDKNTSNRRTDLYYNESNKRDTEETIRNDFRELRREIESIKRRNELKKLGSQEELNHALRNWEREKSHREPVDPPKEVIRSRRETSTERARSNRSSLRSPRGSTEREKRIIEQRQHEKERELALANENRRNPTLPYPEHVSPLQGGSTEREKQIIQQRQHEKERELFLANENRANPPLSHRERISPRQSPPRRDFSSQENGETSVQALRASAMRLSYKREEFERELELIRQRQKNRALHSESFRKNQFSCFLLK